MASLFLFFPLQLPTPSSVSPGLKQFIDSWLCSNSAPSDASEKDMLDREGVPALERRGRLSWSWLERGVKLFLLRRVGGWTSVWTLSNRLSL